MVSPSLGSDSIQRNAVARWISIIAHPFVTTLVMVLGAALHLSSPREALRTVLLVGGISLGPIALLMVRQVRRGSWDNVDASNRAERPLLFTVGIAGLAVLLGIVAFLQPGSFLIRGTAGVMMMLALCAVATHWIKVSLHMAFCALAATTLVFLHSAAGWMLLPLLPLLAWSRLSLGRHSVAEVVAGTGIGAAFGWAIVCW